VRTKALIIEHKQDIDNLANALLEKETLDLQKIIDILGERPFEPRSNYKAYLDLKRTEKKEL
jgi:AFG3 family protein